MTNELLAIFIVIASLSGALIAFKLGANYLKAYVVMSYLTANILTTKIITVFGFDMTPGTFLFSAIFLSTDMLAEKYGKKQALEAVYVSFFATLAFIVLSQLTLLTVETPYAVEAAGALAVIFDTSPRIFIASITAYIVWQYIDVLVYERMHKRTGDGKLWLRNNASTLFSSIGSTFSFFALAFAGTEANWVEMATAGVIVYWIIAMLDTIIIYASKAITPLDQK